MKRRGLFAFFGGILSCCVFLLILTLVKMPRPWVQDYLHRIILHEAARSLNTEVLLGAVDGTIKHDIRLVNLAVAKPAGLTAGTLLQADDITVQYSLWRLAFSRQGLPQRLSSISAAGFSSTLENTPQGIVLPELAQNRTDKSTKKTVWRAGPEIVLTDGELQYLDRVRTSVENKPLQVRLEIQSARVNLGQIINAVQGSGKMPDSLQFFGAIGARCGAQVASVNIDASSEKLILKQLAYIDNATHDFAQVGQIEAPGSLFASLTGNTNKKSGALQIAIIKPQINLTIQTGKLLALRSIERWDTGQTDKKTQSFPLRLAVSSGQLAFKLRASNGAQKANLVFDNLQGDVDVHALQAAINGDASQQIGTLETGVQLTSAATSIKGHLATQFSQGIELSDVRWLCRNVETLNTDQLKINWDLTKFKSAGAGAIQKIAAEKLVADLRMNQQSQFACINDLQTIATSLEPVDAVKSSRQKQKPSQPFTSQIQLANSAVSITIPALGSPGQPVTIATRHLNGGADFSSGYLNLHQVTGDIALLAGALTGKAAISAESDLIHLNNLVFHEAGRTTLQSPQIALTVASKATASRGFLSEIRAEKILGNLQINKAGQLTFLQHFASGKNPQNPSSNSSGFAPRIIFTDSKITVHDTRPAGINRWQATGLKGELDLAQMSGSRAWGRNAGMINTSLTADGPAGKLGVYLQLGLHGLLNIQAGNLTDRHGHEILQLDHGSIQFDGYKMSSGLGAVRNITLDGFNIHVSRTGPTKTNLDSFFISSKTKKSSARISLQTPARLILKRGNAWYTDKTQGGTPFVATVTGIGGNTPLQGWLQLAGGKPVSRNTSGGLVRADIKLTGEGLSGKSELQVRAGRETSLELADGSLKLPGNSQPVISFVSLQTGIGAGQQSITQRFQRLSADSLRARIVRDRQGQIDIVKAIARYFPQGKRSSRSVSRYPEFSKSLALRLRDVTVNYTDYAANTKGPVFAYLQNLRGSAQLKDATGSLAGRIDVKAPGGIARANLKATQLGNSLKLSDLQVSNLQNETFIAVKNASLRYDGKLLIQGKLAQGLRVIQLDSGQFSAKKSADGTLDITSLLAGFTESQKSGQKPPAPARPPLSLGWHGLVRLNEMDFSWEDASRSEVLSARGQQIHGEVQLGYLEAALRGEQSQGAGHLKGNIQVTAGTERLTAITDWELSERLALSDVLLTSTQEEISRARKVQVSYKLSEMLRDEEFQPAAISNILLQNAWAKVLRDEAGKVHAGRLAEVFDNMTEVNSGGQNATLGGFIARVVLEDSGGEYQDLSILNEGKPLHLAFADLTGDVNLGQLSLAMQGKTELDPGWVKGAVTSCEETQGLQAQVMVKLDGEATVSDFLATLDETQNLSVQTAKIGFTPAKLLHEQDFIGAVQRVNLAGVTGSVTVDADSRLQITSCLPALELGGEQQGTSQFAGLVEASAVALQVTDLRSDGPTPRIYMVADAHGRADFSHSDAGVNPVLADIGGDIAVAWPGLRAQAEIASDGKQSVELRDLLVYAKHADQDYQQVVAAHRVMVTADLTSLVAGEVRPEHIKSIELWQGDVLAQRPASGLWWWETVWPQPDRQTVEVETAPGKWRLHGVLKLHDSAIHYQDLLARDGPVKFAGKELAGTINLTALQQLIDGEAIERVGSVQGNVEGQYQRYQLTGKVNTDVIDYLQITSPVLTDMTTGQPALTAASLRGTYDLVSMLESENPLEFVQRLDADELQGEFIHDMQNGLTVGTSQLKLADAQQTSKFTGILSLTKATIRYVQQKPAAHPLIVSTEKLDLYADMGAVELMRRGAPAPSAGNVRGKVQINVGRVQAAGVITGDFSRELSLADLQVSGDNTDTPEWLQAKSAKIEYALASFLSGEPALNHIHFVRIRELEGELSRGTDEIPTIWKMALEDLNQPVTQTSDEKTPLGRFTGLLQADGSRFTWRDSHLSDHGPMIVQIQDFRVDADLAGEGRSGNSLAQGAFQIQTPEEIFTGMATGNPNRALELNNLRVVQTGTGQETFRVNTAGVFANASHMFHDGITNGLEQIRAIELLGAVGTIRRNSEGQITSPEFLALRTGTGEPLQQVERALGPISADILVRDGDITWIDEQALEDAGPLVVRLSGLNGAVRASGDLISDDITQGVNTGVLRGKLQATTPELTLTADIQTDIYHDAQLNQLLSLGDDNTIWASIGQAQVRYRLSDILADGFTFKALDGVTLADASMKLGTTHNGFLTVGGIPVSSVKMKPETAGAQMQLASLEGSLQADEHGSLSGWLKTGNEGAFQGGEATVNYAHEDGWLDFDSKIAQVDLNAFSPLVLSGGEHLTGGTARLIARGYGYPDDKTQGFTWSAKVQVEDGQLHSDRLGEVPIQFAGILTGGPEGVKTKGVNFAWESVSGALKGSVINLQKPAFALVMDIEANRGSDIVQMAPEKIKEQLRGVILSTKSVGNVALTGPVDDFIAQVQMNVMGDTAASIAQVGALRLTGLSLTADIAHSDDGTSILANTRTERVEIDRRTSMASLLARASSSSGPQKLTGASVVYARNLEGATQVTGHVPWARIRGLEIENLEVEGGLEKDYFVVNQLQADIAGGRMIAEGNYYPQHVDGKVATGRLVLTGVDLGKLQRLDLIPRSLGLQGDLKLAVAGAYGGPEDGYTGWVQAIRPVVDGKQFDEAIVALKGSSTGADIQMAQLRQGPGRLWAGGTVNWTQPSSNATSTRNEIKLDSDLEIAAAEVDLSQTPFVPQRAKLQGTGYLKGTIRGDIRDPDITINAQTFKPSLHGHQVDIIVTQGRRQGEVVTIDHVLASSGSAVAGVVNATVTDFNLYRTRGTVVELAPNGTIQPAVFEANGSARYLMQTFTKKSDAEGWFWTLGGISGRLSRPVLDVQMNLDRMRIGEWFVDKARFPLSVEGDTAVIAGGEVEAHGGTFQVLGRVNDLYGASDYTLVGSVDTVNFEDLPPVRQFQVPVEGEASIPRLMIWGSRDTEPRGNATFRANLQRLGDVRLRPFTGWLQLANGMIWTEATRIRKMTSSGSLTPETGSVNLTARYDYRRRFLDSEVRLTGPAAISTDEMPSTSQLARLPDIDMALQLLSPVVQVVERLEGETADDKKLKTPVADGLARYALRLSGRTTGDLRLVGPADALTIKGKLNLWQAQLDNRPLPRQIQAGFTADIARRHVYDLNAEAIDGIQSLSASGELTLASRDRAKENERGRINLMVEGGGLELSQWRAWLPPQVPVGGTATFVVQVQGDSAAPDIKGSADIMGPAYAGVKFDQFVLPQVEVSDGQIDISRARLSSTDEIVDPTGRNPATSITRELEISGKIPWRWADFSIPVDSKWDLEARMEDIDLAFFPPLLHDLANSLRIAELRGRPTLWSQLEARGTVTAHARFTGSRQSPVLDADVQVANGYLRRQGWQYALEDAQLSGVIKPEGTRHVIALDNGSLRWGEAQVKTTQVNAEIASLSSNKLSENRYNARFEVSSRKPMLVSGLEMGRLSGGIELKPVTTEAGADQQHRLSFDKFYAEMGAGNLKVNGSALLNRFGLENLDKNDYDIEILAERAQVRMVKLFTGTVDGSIKLSSGAPDQQTKSKRPRISGNLNLADADVSPAMSSGSGASKLTGISREISGVDLDLAMNLGPEVRLRGLGVNIPLEPGEVMRLTGTLQEPTASGTVVASGGSIILPTGKLFVRSGSVAFNFAPVKSDVPQDVVPLRLDGTVDAHIERLLTNVQVPGWGNVPVQVNVIVSGNIPDDVRVTLTSDPPLGSQQIASLIGIGYSLDGQGVSGSTTDLLSQQALNALAMGFRVTVFQPIEESLVRVLGLSEFSIVFGVDQVVQVRLGKYLLEDLLVSYQQSISEDDVYELSISYRLNNRVRVAFTKDESNDSRLEVSYGIGF